MRVAELFYDGKLGRVFNDEKDTNIDVYSLLSKRVEFPLIGYVEIPSNLNINVISFNIPDGEYDSKYLPQLEEKKEKQIEKIKNKRYNLETNEYIIVNINDEDIKISTSERSSLKLLIALSKTITNPETVFKWKISDNEKIDLTRDDILYIISKISDYTENLFSKEYELITKIKECSTIEEVRSVLWPEVE
jgi:hypothetical protein